MAEELVARGDNEPSVLDGREVNQAPGARYLRPVRQDFPESCSLEACDAGDGNDADADALSRLPWRELLPRTRLQAHTRHFYEEELSDAGRATHVRFNIFPDGGVSRLRLYGRISADV